MTMADWTILAKIISPTALVLVIVIFWLMRQNQQLVREIFNHNSTLSRLTSLLENLVYNKRVEK